MIERKAHIFNIQKYNMYDGPGVRTLVFFKGCPLRCDWCSNPEGQKKPFQVLYKRDNCINCGRCVEVCPVGVHKLSPTNDHIVDRSVECIGCRKCESACLKSALAIVGEVKTISEILAIVEEDRSFYEMSGGGLTIGGGEVLMQPEAAISLLSACKQHGINTAIETCGYAKLDVVKKVSEVCDTFLYDIKHMDSNKHRELTGVRNEMVLTNVQWLLENKCNVKIRVPLLKGVNDSKEELDQLMDFLMPYVKNKNFLGVDLLPYHKMGVNKYKQLDWEYPIEGDPALSSEDLNRVEGYFINKDFPISVVKH